MVPSGSGWEIAAVFALGRCRGRRTSRQDRRSTHVNDASVSRCRGLLQPVPPPVCSVVVQSVLDVIRIPGTTVCRINSSFSSFLPLFFVFFVGWFFKKDYQVLEQIMFAAACCIVTIKFSFFFAFLSAPKCMHQGRMVIALYQRSSLLPKIKWLYSCIHTSF